MTQKILTIAPLLMFLAAIYTVSMFAVFAAVAFLAIRYYESFVFYEMEKPTIAVQAVLLLAHIGVFFFTHFEPQNSTLFADVPPNSYCALMRLFIMLLSECAGLALLLFLLEAERSFHGSHRAAEKMRKIYKMERRN